MTTITYAGFGAAAAKVSAGAAKTPAPAYQYDHPGLDPNVVKNRITQGRVAEMGNPRLPRGIAAAGAPSYFRTYEQIKAVMNELAAKHPEFVQVIDIGDSGEKARGTADRDILSLRLTNKNTTGAKPKLIHVGGVHAREIANPELLMQFATDLLNGYGKDPQATMLLDTREIDLVVMANPDGHAVVEKGFAKQPGGDLMKRKNTTGADGTDINRNFAFHWGGPGASTNPRAQDYRGASAASESETRAIHDYTGLRKPNVFIDWHSYSKLVMYPWGDTKNHAPDHVGLKAVAERFAGFNKYSPVQSIELYPTTGTTDDDAYGSFGVPSWAIETGSSFHQSDKEFAQTLKENLPVLWYAGRIADDPYARAQAPDVVSIAVDGAKVSAVVSGKSSKDTVSGAELVLDPFAKPGTGMALKAADGTFDSADEQVSLDLTGASNGASQALAGWRANQGGDGKPGLIFVRAKDAQGNWGPLLPQWGAATSA